MSPENQTGMPAPAVCPRCQLAMRPAMVRTAIWREDRLFVVEDIPAQVCDACMEQFYDEETTDALRRLTESGFTSVDARHEIVVPIFSLEGQIVRRAVADESANDD